MPNLDHYIASPYWLVAAGVGLVITVLLNRRWLCKRNP